MKAYVCDKCGKVLLCEEDDRYALIPEGICFLSEKRKGGVSMELCTECVAELMAAIREQKEGASDA